jgi:hypothetical protein
MFGSISNVETVQSSVAGDSDLRTTSYRIDNGFIEFFLYHGLIGVFLITLYIAFLFAKTTNGLYGRSIIVIFILLSFFESSLFSVGSFMSVYLLTFILREIRNSNSKLIHLPSKISIV